MANEFKTRQSGSDLLNGRKENDTGEILNKRRLENDMELILYDYSRSMTEDRWIVEIHCKAFIPLNESFWAAVSDEDSRHNSVIREMLGDKLVFASSKKRIFVKAEERDALLREMVQQLYDSTLAYLNRLDFPRRLFEKQYRDALRKVLIREAMGQA